VGILFESGSLDELVTGAREASISTHGGSLAIAAAAATAAAVSAAVDGASPMTVLDLAVRAATLAQTRWPVRSAPLFSDAILAAHDYLHCVRERSASDIAARCFPNQPLTIVPLALGLATVMHSAEDAILLAANIGGDSDSVASIAGGILGAIYPETVNESWYATVEAVNGHGLTVIGEALARLRAQGGGAIDSSLGWC
jgi:ADP-ribosylglycohydrolase